MAKHNHNPLSVRVLQQVLTAHGWKQNDLADHSNINRATVSMHLCDERPIRDDHLVRYLTALDRHERQMLMAAWIRDTLSPESVSDILDLPTNRILEHVRKWAPGLSPEQTKMLDWWAYQLCRDPELATIFESITKRVGFTLP